MCKYDKNVCILVQNLQPRGKINGNRDDFHKSLNIISVLFVLIIKSE